MLHPNKNMLAAFATQKLVFVDMLKSENVVKTHFIFIFFPITGCRFGNNDLNYAA